MIIIYFTFFQVFRELELPAELKRIKDLRSLVRVRRDHFVSAISNNTDVSNLETLVKVELARYEEAVQAAAQGGLIIEADNDFPMSVEKWSILQAIFFCSTVLTTIGNVCIL